MDFGCECQMKNRKNEKKKKSKIKEVEKINKRKSWAHKRNQRDFGFFEKETKGIEEIKNQATGQCNGCPQN